MVYLMISGMMMAKLSPEKEISLTDALDLIGLAFGNLEDTLYSGLPDGKDSDWCYDEQLVFDIAKAVQAWNSRIKGNDET